MCIKPLLIFTPPELPICPNSAGLLTSASANLELVYLNPSVFLSHGVPPDRAAFADPMLYKIHIQHILSMLWLLDVNEN